ncbi:glycoside hydrolase, partial [Mycobacterium sp. ITM-2017-0098]
RGPPPPAGPVVLMGQEVPPAPGAPLPLPPGGPVPPPPGAPPLPPAP